ncbi:MAG: hypothetical protein WCK67_04460 [bacterium]
MNATPIKTFASPICNEIATTARGITQKLTKNIKAVEPDILELGGKVTQLKPPTNCTNAEVSELIPICNEAGDMLLKKACAEISNKTQQPLSQLFRETVQMPLRNILMPAFSMLQSFMKKV